jgi:hypothetical protein
METYKEKFMDRYERCMASITRFIKTRRMPMPKRKYPVGTPKTYPPRQKNWNKWAVYYGVLNILAFINWILANYCTKASIWIEL